MATSADPAPRALDVLLPINIDRFQSPITTLMREVVSRLPGHRFYSFSKPGTAEDRELAPAFWGHEHVEKCSLPIVLKRRFDLVWHASVTPSNLLAARLARLRGLGRTRHLVTANVEMGPALRYARLFKMAMRGAHQVVAVSEAVADMVERSYGVRAAEVIPNGFDPDFYSVGDAPLPEGVPEKFFLFCGALTPRKRPDLLIDIARELPDCHFVVVGGNPFPEVGQGFIDQMGALGNVRYLGLRERREVRDLMRRARALVFPSEREGLPLSVIEAMGCGCAVIAQPKSSLPEVVRDGTNGWLLEDKLDLWVERCRAIHRSPDPRPIDPATVRASVTGRFTWPAIAAAYDRRFRAMATTNPHPPE